MSLYTRAAAAEYLGMSLSSFERHVQPHITVVRQTARLIHVTKEELDRWVAEKQELPPTPFETSTGPRRQTPRSAAPATGSRSGSPGGLTDAERAKLQKLQRTGTRKPPRAA